MLDIIYGSLSEMPPSLFWNDNSAYHYCHFAVLTTNCSFVTQSPVYIIIYYAQPLKQKCIDYNVRYNKTSLTTPLFNWSACTKPRKWAVMYLCVRCIDFTFCYDFDIWIWNCSYSGHLFFFHFLHVFCVIVLCDKLYWLFYL